MSTEKAILKRIKGRRVVVIGELILDSYIQGNCTRMAPEASVPVVDLAHQKYCLGGAANLAANLKALGAEVIFLSVCGEDRAGEEAIALLDAKGINTGHVITSSSRVTLQKTRISSQSQLLVRLDEGTVATLYRRQSMQLKLSITQTHPWADLILIADYDKGIIGDDLIAHLIKLQSRDQKFIAVDAKDYRKYKPLKPALIKPNFTEALSLVEQQVVFKDREREVAHWGPALYAQTSAASILLTMDSSGVCGFQQADFNFHLPVTAVERPAVSGAGDTFLAAAALTLSAGADLATSGKMAALAAGHVITRPYTAVCNLKALSKQLFNEHKLLKGKTEINGKIASYKKEGKRIVFTNGCFDILHSGHVSYLAGAKAMGDILIVGLNTDQSISRLKGSSRPINRFKDRLEVLAALSSVDHVVPFGKQGEDTPVSLLSQIKPQIFVKGADYLNRYLPEKEILDQFGCEIAFIPLVAHKSTSGVIAKINQTAFSGLTSARM